MTTFNDIKQGGYFIMPPRVPDSERHVYKKVSSSHATIMEPGTILSTIEKPVEFGLECEVIGLLL